MYFQAILSIVSKLGPFMVMFAIFYFLIKFTVCKLLKLNRYVILNKLYLDDILSIIISILFITKFFTFYPVFLLI